MRLLVVEDHPVLGLQIKKGLERCHYLVDLVTDGEEALACESNVPYDLIILDILLPGLSGRDVCSQLREMHRQVPILFLTALGSVEDRIQGLNLGADDYLTKPFDFRELEARVRALLRRESTQKDPILHFSDITLDTRTHEVRRGERLITVDWLAPGQNPARQPASKMANITQKSRATFRNSPRMIPGKLTCLVDIAISRYR